MAYRKRLPKLFRHPGFTWYCLAYSVFLISGFALLVTSHHGDTVLFINRLSEAEWDRLADWITRIGLGSTMVIVAIVFALYQLRYTFMFLFDLAFVGIITMLFKKLLFPEIVRPLKHFSPENFHRMVQLADKSMLHSFPSGHTMTIFAMMGLLAYFTRKRMVSIFFLLIAVLVGFTRIYLLQHFFIDVYVGSLLGVVCTLTTIWLGDYVFRLKFHPVLNRSLLFLLRQRTNRSRQSTEQSVTFLKPGAKTI